MLGTSTTSSVNSSAPIISGTPAAIGFVEDVINYYESFIKRALDEVATETQADVRKQASSKDGWRDLADKINVRFDHDDRELRYSVDTEDQDRVQALEFGTATEAPNPLLRTHAAEGRQDFTERVTTRVHELMGNL